MAVSRLEELKLAVAVVMEKQILNLDFKGVFPSVCRPRSRGKTAVEDEDSMDGLEAAETENTVEAEVKEQSAEEDAQTEVDSTKQLTPVLQHSISEESPSSTASVGVEAKTSDVHIVSTLEPLSNAVKRNVPRCTITPVLLEQARFRISVTCPSFVQTILIRLLKDQKKKQIAQCATALETSWINFFNCRVCAECGTRTSCQWHHNCLVCDSCYQQQDNLSCPFCEKLCLQDFQKDMLHCHMCKRWIHVECDRSPGSELESQLKDYICTLCKQGEGDQSQSCDIMDTSELIPEPDNITACTNEMEMESGGEDAFQEQPITGDGPGQESAVGCVTDVTGVLAEEKTTELETQVSAEINSAEMEMSPKKTPASGDSQTGKMTDMMEGVQAVTQQELNKQVEETQLPQGSVEVSEVSTVDSRSLSSIPETLTVTPEVQETESKGDICIPVEQQLEKVKVQNDVEKGETREKSETPTLVEVETSAANEGVAHSSPVGDKPVKSPAEISPSLPPSLNINKTSVSSSPDVSVDLHSPRDVQQTQPAVLPSTAGSALPTTYISVTPKIGMGKPAITKRKFSPGRPRSRQGHGSGFPGKRRPRGAGLSGRGGRGRSKLKNGVGTVVVPGVSTMDISSNKDEEENSMHNTVVLFSNSDKFTLHQDMCVVCGSFGQGAEGRLLACSQCGQCYHPYCVSIKITKVVLSKGWRCLECTVCEACGKATDPGRLLLCDDCDISYHTYCLDPPLQTVPKGGWKCKWCVWFWGQKY
ncbi:PREDICTED: histone-lysine N-methyltransferase 2C-like [Buceros rhinoceros silvestris]|uniref:histone-lysine N-methyltransferase 2C-like n=1 Tax=Buceros rhinoceros silvestris TaxID=175836 RepID=UPI0005293C5D|nr:PREDICTED: histone-lysine N-methyltransferase 2C-like [Buceros rhinoceros silvestris]